MEYLKFCDSELVIVFIYIVCFIGELIELVVCFFFLFKSVNVIGLVFFECVWLLSEVS